MKRFFSSLYWKISAIFLLLLMVIGGIYAYLTLFTVEMYVQEATQKVSAPLAQRIVDKVTMIREGEVIEDVAEDVFRNAAMLNPGIEIYLLDPKGRVMASSAPAEKVRRHRISREPIEAFIALDGGRFIAGDDPQNPNQQKVFSAAPVRVDGALQGYVYVILRGEEYDSALDMLQDSYILRYGRELLIVSLIAAGVLGLIVIRLLTRKLRRMKRGVEAFERGDYQARIPVQSNDELDQLAKAFNSMAATTRRNMEEIKRSDALRRELVANVSHDLRTPLASIQGYVETLMLKEDELSEAERREYLQIIRSGTDRLSRLISQLFELSKLDARQTEQEREPFALAELVYDVVHKFEPRAKGKEVDLKIEAPASLPLLHGDIRMLERALDNLLDNAIQYSPSGGSVAVRLEHSESALTVEVTDQGPGIPTDEIGQIFDRFYRVDKSRGSNHDGAGLGLAITKKIIEAHGGTIKVESRDGATFRIWLPLLTRDPEASRDDHRRRRGERDAGSSDTESLASVTEDANRRLRTTARNAFSGPVTRSAGSGPDPSRPRGTPDS